MRDSPGKADKLKVHEGVGSCARKRLSVTQFESLPIRILSGRDENFSSTTSAEALPSSKLYS
jgi:hypothetical protein